MKYKPPKYIKQKGVDGNCREHRERVNLLLRHNTHEHSDLGLDCLIKLHSLINPSPANIFSPEKVVCL